MGKLMTELGTGQGWLKAGFLGLAKSGKTYTALMLGLITREHFGLDGPIAMYDTEGGSPYIGPTVQQATGKPLLGIRSRSFDDMLALGMEAEQEGAAVLIVDSVTHPWRELMDAYLQRVNNARAAKGLSRRTRLEFQDWGPIKETWGKWTDFYLNSKLHIIVCGRAGDVWSWETNEETDRKELRSVGVKMKTETEFGFEPSLLVHMERDHHPDGTLVHNATVLGDRFGLIDAKETAFKGHGDWKKDRAAVGQFFMPHLQALQPGAHAPIDTEVRTNMDVDEEGNNELARWRREKTIVLEEIKGWLLKAWPGSTTSEKSAKADLLEEIFATRSWTKVENLPLSILRAGFEVVRERVEKKLGIKQPDDDVPSVDNQTTQRITHACEDCGQGFTGLPEDETCFACNGKVRPIDDADQTQEEPKDKPKDKPKSKRKKAKKKTAKAAKKTAGVAYACMKCGQQYMEVPQTGLCTVAGCFGRIVVGAEKVQGAA